MSVNTLKWLVSILLLTFSGVYLAESLSLEVGSVKLPGPGFLPTVVGIFLGFLVLFHLIEGFLFGRKSLGVKKEEFPQGRNFLRLIEILSLLAFCGVFLEKLGYILTTIILVGASLYFLEMRGWVRIVLISILTSGCSYYFFRVMFDIPLPQGIFPF